MNILITGIHGFIGSNFVEALQHKHSIYGLDITSPQKGSIIKTYEWNELEKLPDSDVIIHLAGKAHDTKNKSKTEEYFNVNYGLTKKIFDFFLKSEAQVFIFFSSVKAAAESVSGDILTEDVIPSPVGPYGESKIKAEEYILSKNWDTKKVYVFRPCMIHGPGNKGNLNLLYNFVKKNIPWPLGAFDNQRSFLNIWNLSFILEQFILNQPKSGIYHLSDDKPISTNELIELISLSLGKKHAILYLNKTIIQKVAKWGDFLKIPLNTERLRKLTENYVVSNQKAKNAIGIEQLPINVKDGLFRTLESFKKNR